MAKKRVSFAFAILVACAIPLVTLATTLTLCKSLSHVPEWLWLPQISLTGNHPPERFVYAVGFGLSALALAAGMTFFHTKLIAPRLHRSGMFSEILNWVGLAAAIIAAFGLFVQAVVPLQTDFIGSSSESVSLQLTTLIHLTGAAIFFFSALAFEIILIILFRISVGLDSLIGRWWYTKIALVCIYFVAFIITSAGGAFPTTVQFQHLIASIGQWSVVLSFIAFAGTLAGDVWTLEGEDSEFGASARGTPEVETLLGKDS